jgi:cytochrome bd-type quinol oxidase subunit 2
MISLLVCCIVLVFAIGIFYVFGKTYSSITKTKMDVFEQIGIGFFLYYGSFQMIALPCILMKQSLSLLSVLWAIIVIGMVVICACIIWKRRKITKVEKNKVSLSLIKQACHYFI